MIESQQQLPIYNGKATEPAETAPSVLATKDLYDRIFTLGGELAILLREEQDADRGSWTNVVVGLKVLQARAHLDGMKEAWRIFTGETLPDVAD